MTGKPCLSNLAASPGGSNCTRKVDRACKAPRDSGSCCSLLNSEDRGNICSHAPGKALSRGCPCGFIRAILSSVP